MIRPSAILLLAIITIFSQSVLARGGPGNVDVPHGYSAGGAPGQMPDTLSAMNDQALTDNQGFDTQLNFIDPANISLDKRGFDQPLDEYNPGTPSSLMAQPTTLANHNAATLNTPDPTVIGPGDQGNNGAIQRGFPNPLLNPGLTRLDTTAPASTNNSSDTSGFDNHALYNKSENNQRVMERFPNLEADDIPPGILARQKALGYEFVTATSPSGNSVNHEPATQQANLSQSSDQYDPFADDTAQGKAKDKAKKKNKKKDKTAD